MNARSRNIKAKFLLSFTGCNLSFIFFSIISVQQTAVVKGQTTQKDYVHQAFS